MPELGKSTKCATQQCQCYTSLDAPKGHLTLSLLSDTVSSSIVPPIKALQHSATSSIVSCGSAIKESGYLGLPAHPAEAPVDKPAYDDSSYKGRACDLHSLLLCDHFGWHTTGAEAKPLSRLTAHEFYQ